MVYDLSSMLWHMLEAFGTWFEAYLGDVGHMV
jgi:hypothetical protein